MLSQTIRREFLAYFKQKGHMIVPSSPVIPHEDPSLLFTNAGMNQFKDVFTGKARRDYTRAATSQKCIRAGGKHNDLENVGHTSRHLTFFEMLGNFSFGDYFKEQAIAFAWEVTTQVFKFDPEKVWATIYLDDEEAYELWQKWVPRERIVRFGEKENFWSMGDIGPCGPCSELLYDRGDRYGNAKSPRDDASGERYLEYWNLVFMQFNKTAEGVLEKLPKPSIDTGAGLERVVSLRMGEDNVFLTDILGGLIKEVALLCNKPYVPRSPEASAYQVIADHIRSLSFAIADGAIPSNTDRGYVLRKILRRAVRYGKQLGFEEPFLGKLVPKLTMLMGGDYPELKQAEKHIQDILEQEEIQFFRTLKRGGDLLQSIIEKAKTSSTKFISGDAAFKLKDTYGLPLEEIELIAKDHNLTIDEASFHKLEQEAKERSRATQNKLRHTASQVHFEEYLQTKGECLFVGYESHNTDGSITAIIKDGAFVESLSAGEEAEIILSKTPFYAEKGGQVGDTGIISHKGAVFIVDDCYSPLPNVIIHRGKLQSGSIIVSEPVHAVIDEDRRVKIENNHTATHLLNYALEKVLGGHIRQAGSYVGPDQLRFDFSHNKPLSKKELEQIEAIVNKTIREDSHIHTEEIAYEVVQTRTDIKQVFGDKYGAVVRMIAAGPSKELCGGTHTSATGKIGLFVITKEASISAGVRRIEALTGEAALEYMQQREEILSQACHQLKTTPANLLETLARHEKESQNLQSQLRKMKQQHRGQLLAELEEEFGKTSSFFFGKVLPEGSEQEDLVQIAEALRKKKASYVLCLGLKLPERCQLLLQVSADQISSGIKANEVLQKISPIIEGGGGGKADSAQAGGKKSDQLMKAIQECKVLVNG